MLRGQHPVSAAEPLETTGLDPEIRLPQFRLRSDEIHLFHLLVLRSDRESVHVHRYRYDDLGTGLATTTTSTAGCTTRSTATSRTATTETVGVQSGLHAFPLGPAILEPDLHLREGKKRQLFVCCFGEQTGRTLGSAGNVPGLR